MMQPREVALEWSRRAADEGDVFAAFVYCWFAFNALYNPRHASNSERDAIRAFLGDELRAMVPGLLADLLCDADVQYFSERVVLNVRNQTRDTSEERAQLDSVELTDIERVTALVLILYQIRCNLFHGNKRYSREADQEVVERAGRVLARVLAICLDDDGVLPASVSAGRRDRMGLARRDDHAAPSEC